ncbi:MAG: hypothetical protein OXH00_08000 [Candidatus Poribacteria bacterium]|nr:hypothetical protein [Candidatus Poribacteria bacterium]
MSKRKIVFALLLFASISLLNIVVLIEASYQENQLVVDPLEQQPLQYLSTVIVYNKVCNSSSMQCDIAQVDDNCYLYRYNCKNEPEPEDP